MNFNEAANEVSLEQSAGTHKQEELAQKQLEATVRQGQINDFNNKHSSLIEQLSDKGSIKSSKDEAHRKRRYGLLQTASSAVFVGVPQVTTSLIPKSAQESMQPLMMMGKGLAGLVSIYIKALDKGHDSKVLKSTEKEIERLTKELHGLKHPDTHNTGLSGQNAQNDSSTEGKEAKNESKHGPVIQRASGFDI